MKEIRSRFPSPDKVSISARSTLVLEGNVTIHSLTLDGALRVSASEGAEIEVEALTCVNKGWEFVPVEASDEEALQIRGYKKKEHEGLVVDAPNPGKVVVNR